MKKNKPTIFGEESLNCIIAKGKFTIQKNRHIRSRAGNQWNGLDDLYDLIVAGLVEKVVEDE